MDKCMIDDIIGLNEDIASWLSDVRSSLDVIETDLAEALREINACRQGFGNLDRVYNLVDKVKNLSEEF